MERCQRNRRTLLYSPAAWLLLRPFIRTAQALADGIKTPRCLLLMSKAQGMYPHNRPEFWVPTVDNGQLVLPRALGSYEPVKNSLNFLCGYDLKAMRVGLKKPDGRGDSVDWHHSSVTLFNGGLLPNSEMKNDSVAPATAETLDWYVARKWNTQPLNFSPLYSAAAAPYKNGERISWRKDDTTGAVSAVQCTFSLAQGWNEVFRSVPSAMGTTPTAEQVIAQKRAGIEKSILDHTIEDTQALGRVLSAEQRQFLDQHQTALRELEGRLFAAPAGITAGCAPPAAPPSGSATESQDVMLQRIKSAQELLLASMRCGLRPVMGFHLGHMDGGQMKPGLWDNGSQYLPPSLQATPEKSSYHIDLWHRAGDTASGTDWMQNLEQRVHRFFAEIVVGMKGIPSGSTNLLDQSVVLWGSDMSYDHSNQNHSFLMAGSGGGRIKTGRVLKTNDMSSRSGAGSNAHNDVLLSTLHALGFGDVTSYGTPEFCKGGVTGL